MMNRRQFLVATVAGLGALATGRYVLGNEEDAIIAVLRKRLDYLILDEKGLHGYAADLVDKKIISSRRLRSVDAAGPIYANLEMPPFSKTLTYEVRHGEERVISLYLLSSDFFLNGSDETQVVQYLGYYDPISQSRRCANPFSRPLVT